MIKSTKNNNELVKICRGGQTIWESLSCELHLKTPRPGDNKISGYFFPKKGSTIAIKFTKFNFDTYEDEIIYSNNSPSVVDNFFEFRLPFSLKEGDNITFKITNPNCIPAEFSTTIRR